MKTQAKAKDPPRSNMALTSPKHCRALLAKLIRQTLDGKFDSGDLRVLTYSIMTLVNIIKDSDLEQRIAALERHSKNETKS